MDHENNLGFLRNTLNWEHSILNGQSGNYRLYNVRILNSFGPYQKDDSIQVMDVSLISGKIDIHRENKDLLTLDFTAQFKYCARCDNTRETRDIFYRIYSCPSCSKRR